MSANTILTSIVTGGTNSHATVAEEANSLATDFVTAGVVGTITANTGSGGSGSFCVNADSSPDMGVTVKAGQAYITATPSGQNSQVLRARASTDYTAYTINSNSSGSTKYDWIYLSVSATNANTPSASADNVTSIYTSRSSSNTTDNGTPPTYGILLAVVTVANGASSITNANISDRRTQASVSAAGTSAATGWNSLGYTPSTVTANGNRSYSLTFSSVDLTSTLSKGMRLLLTRTTAAPTQCTSLNGSTQYYSKTSPSGMTFTDDFVVSAWVKLNSYQAGTIVSRYSAGNGWSLDIITSGQLRLTAYNGGVGNASQVISYQSLPLNKWVHVAAQLDMSTFTATTTTSYIMFDGVDVPASVNRSGTNPTALVQAGNLEVGTAAAGTFWNGKIAQVAIYNAKVTQATILASIHQTLSGSETSLISAYSFNNSTNDLSANANNLSANGSAVATNADSPFAQGATAGLLEYGIVQLVSYSTNTTVVAQVPEGSAIPTSGGVSAVSYSLVKEPFGMPIQQTKWEIECLINASAAPSGTSTTTVYNPGGINLLRPIGDWGVYGRLGWQFTFTTATADAYCGLSSSSSSFTQGETGGEIREYSSGWSSAPIRIFNTNHYIPSSGTTTANFYTLMYAGTAVSALQLRGVITSANTYEYSRIWAVPSNL